MAEVNHYNKIQIARGNIDKKDALLSEIFYDYNRKAVFIGVKNTGSDAATKPAIWKRFGGFDSIVIKGTIGSTAEYTALIKGELRPGDAYIVTGNISVAQYEIIKNAEGEIVRGGNYRRYDDFFKNGQVIVYCEEDVRSIPNAAVVGSDVNESKYGFITLSGASEAVDIENDTSYQPIGAEAVDPHDITGAKSGLNDVQSALDYLFNNKMQYAGSFNNILLTSDDIASYFPPSAESTPNISEEDYWKAVAEKKTLLPGQFIIYNGPTQKVSIYDKELLIRGNTAIVATANVRPVDVADNTLDELKLENTIWTFPMGAGDANEVEFHFTGSRKSTEELTDISTKDESGTAKTINGGTPNTVDGEIETVTQALDNLHQTKADLNAQGKIPLSQIPNTFVGALQYIGTYTPTYEGPEAVGDGTNSILILTVEQLFNQISNVTGGWEKEGEGAGTDTEYNRLDNGDYVIVNGIGQRNIVNGEDYGESYERSGQVVVVDSSNNELFRFSNGDHIIVNNVEYDNDGNVNTSTLKFDVLDTSSAVDAVNGMTAEVDVIGSHRNVTNYLGNANTDVKTVDIDVDLVEHTIKVDIPNAAVEDTELAKNTIPKAAAGRNLVKSDIVINDASNTGSAYKEDNPDTTADESAHNTELTGKLSNGTTDVTIEFPDESGKLMVKPDGDGTEDFLSKFNRNGTLIDSSVKQTQYRLEIFENLGKDIADGEKPLFALHYGEDEDDNPDVKVFDIGNISYRFDFEGDANVNGRRAKGRHTVHENRVYDEDIHTILDDCSTLDGGEWV